MTEMIRLYKKCPSCEGYDGECRVCDGDGYVEHGQVQPCVDHPVLDRIYAILGHSDLGFLATCRQSECVEFADADGRHFEVVVREIDGDEGEDDL